jgi:transcriptional regulator with XRE-family HTH domain
MVTIEELRKRVRAARGYAGLSQPELARELGISKETVKRMEAPGGRPVDRLADIARICTLPYEFFTVDFADLPALASGSYPRSTAVHADTDTEVDLLVRVADLDDLVMQINGRLAQLGAEPIHLAAEGEGSVTTPEQRLARGRDVARRSADRARARVAASEPPQSGGSEPQRRQPGTGQEDDRAGRARRPRSA